MYQVFGILLSSVLTTNSFYNLISTAAMSTFVRFFPQVKARYDYGILIFILTFSLVSISGFRSDEILKLAQERLSTILIGASTCVIVSVLVCPVWAGGDLHLHVAQNIENLGKIMEGMRLFIGLHAYIISFVNLE